MFSAFVISVNNGEGITLTFLVLAYSQANAIDRVLEEEMVRKDVGSINVVQRIPSQYLLSTEEQLEELIVVLSN